MLNLTPSHIWTNWSEEAHNSISKNWWHSIYLTVYVMPSFATKILPYFVRFSGVWPSKNGNSCPWEVIFSHLSDLTVVLCSSYIWSICDTFFNVIISHKCGRRILLLTHNIISCICIIYSVQALRLLDTFTQSAIRTLRKAISHRIQ